MTQELPRHDQAPPPVRKVDSILNTETAIS